MRVTFVISNLDSGGAERVVSILCGHLAERGFQVTLITLNDSVPDHYRLAPAVNRVRLQLRPLRGSWWSRRLSNVGWIVQLRKAIKNSAPDAVVSFMDAINVMTLIATLGTKIPVIISERVDPRRHDAAFPWNRLRPLTYPRADALVVQTERVASWAKRVVPPRKVWVIPNPAIPTSSTERPLDVTLPPPPFALAMGRLTHQKGFDILIRAFSRCAASDPQRSLVILGKGPDESALKKLADQLGIPNQVHFSGVASEPTAVMRRACFFVLSSRYEGFPNALVEAMTAGLAVIATDCPSGPRELVEHERNGLLVPPEDVAALSDGMSLLFENAGLRRRLGESAAGIVSRLGIDEVGKQWETLLTSVARRST